MNGTRHTSLEERDYLAILDIIPRMLDCRCREDIKISIQKYILPLFEAQSAMWVWVDVDFLSERLRNPKFIGSAGIPEEELEIIHLFVPYQFSIPQKIAETTRLVVAHDIDIPREKIEKEKDLFFADHPQYRGEKGNYLRQPVNILGTIDRPDFSLAFGIQRRFPFDKPFTLRDIRVLELIQPHLLRVIKTVVLNEELTKYKALTETLAETSSAVALVSLDHRIIFRNATFSQLLPVQENQRLPRKVADLLETEASKYISPFSSDSSTLELPFIQLPKGMFRLTASPMSPQGEVEEQCWLLQLKPATEPFSQMNLLMQNKSLTPREMEIAYLICDGMTDQEIGGRLFISIHTVKNHFKSIYRKFDVHSRTQLVATLQSFKPTPEG
ncbi:hypothetical protein NITGR_150045 [Nitrospina gracilis 3/211]|uniref:HTH luxR-type domain-containing protein n=1 Tax=Nitrospina gracilis (strain 3/211) TaxID=1266370 RepID=M1Z978_NITG3|nr:MULTISPECIES: helix-turn-helix transcriptional regulator [Nitrospina]MCF8722729.1 DNA-binding CsgD family transcriptional regulator [Nitrospina sp. Nb-3]CCQ89677.1 hypothetical protein NITGR_150045 [Nitrospina gracilis 3/211]